MGSLVSMTSSKEKGKRKQKKTKRTQKSNSVADGVQHLPGMSGHLFKPQHHRNTKKLGVFPFGSKNSEGVWMSVLAPAAPPYAG